MTNIMLIIPSSIMILQKVLSREKSFFVSALINWKSKNKSGGKRKIKKYSIGNFVKKKLSTSTNTSIIQR